MDNATGLPYTYPLNGAIHQISRYPVDKYYGNQLHLLFSMVYARKDHRNDIKMLPQAPWGVANGTWKNMGLGKFWQDLENVFDKSRSLVLAWFVFTFFESRNFLPKSLGLGFLTRISASRQVSDFTIRHPFHGREWIFSGKTNSDLFLPRLSVISELPVSCDHKKIWWTGHGLQMVYWKKKSIMSFSI